MNNKKLVVMCVCCLLPVSLRIHAFILQVDYLAGVVAADLSIGVMDDTVLVVSSKELQASLLHCVHLMTHQSNIRSIMRAN